MTVWRIVQNIGSIWDILLSYVILWKLRCSNKFWQFQKDHTKETMYIKTVVKCTITMITMHHTVLNQHFVMGFSLFENIWFSLWLLLSYIFNFIWKYLDEPFCWKCRFPVSASVVGKTPAWSCNSRNNLHSQGIPV